MRKLLRILVYWLSFVIQPRKILVFSSFPDFSDNPYALYMYLVKHKWFEKYQLVWILNNPTDEVISSIKVTCPNVIISCTTLKNWYYVIVSRYIFSSHNAYEYLHFKQKDKLFNLWHGLPWKKIGYDNEEYGVKNGIYTTASSPFYVEVMSSAFRIPREHVLLTGCRQASIFKCRSMDADI